VIYASLNSLHEQDKAREQADPNQVTESAQPKDLSTQILGPLFPILVKRHNHKEQEEACHGKHPQSSSLVLTCRGFRKFENEY